MLISRKFIVSEILACSLPNDTFLFVGKARRNNNFVPLPADTFSSNEPTKALTQIGFVLKTPHATNGGSVPSAGLLTWKSLLP